MKPAALIPAKSFGRAKSRLAGVLSEEERARLARFCFERVVEALSRSARFGTIAVCTDGEEVGEFARALGCAVYLDPPDAGSFSEIVDAGLARLASHAERALVVMADLPEAEPESFAPVLAARADVVLVPDAEGLGTSALSLPLPAAFETAFGNHDSAERHLALAKAAGLGVSRVDVPSLARDVDGPLHLVGRRRLLLGE